ncbi:MAG: fimbrillin family protein [Prevotella sp.]|nr:fimbrillin family protein [Prevotella sp.]
MKYFPSISQYKLTSVWLTACLMLLSACSDSKEFVYIDEDEDGEVTLTLMDTNGNTNVIPSGSQVGAYIVGDDGAVSFQQVEIGGDGCLVLPPSARGQQLYVYSPYQEDWVTDALSDTQLFQVQSDQSTLSSFQASDLMIGSLDNSDGTNTSMTLSHLMAKVVIHIIDESGLVDMNQVSAELLNVFHRANIDIKKATATTIEDEVTNIRMYPEISTDWRLSTSAILPSQTVTAGTDFFAITVYGVCQTYSLPEDTILKGGQTFTLNIRLTDQGVIFDGSYVTDWEEDSEKIIEIKS